MTWLTIELLAFGLFSIVMLFAKAESTVFNDETGDDVNGHL